LARRLGVPFEPVLYPSVGALLDNGKSGAWDVAFVGFSPARAEEWDFTGLQKECRARLRASSNLGALEALKSGRADVMGSIKPILFDMSAQLPGSRVLEGRASVDPHVMVMPKGRGPALAYARQFIENAKSDGWVSAAIERAGLRGVVVAP
jgi:polar amino acid transport system substrate-binding protein